MQGNNRMAEDHRPPIRSRVFVAASGVEVKLLISRHDPVYISLSTSLFCVQSFSNDVQRDATPKCITVKSSSYKSPRAKLRCGFGHQLLTRYGFGHELLTCSMQYN